MVDLSLPVPPHQDFWHEALPYTALVLQGLMHFTPEQAQLAMSTLKQRKPRETKVVVSHKRINTLAVDVN